MLYTVFLMGLGLIYSFQTIYFVCYFKKKERFHRLHVLGMSLNMFYFAFLLFQIVKNIIISLMISFILGFTFLQDVHFLIIFLLFFLYNMFSIVAALCFTLLITNKIKGLFTFTFLVISSNVCLLNLYKL